MSDKFDRYKEILINIPGEFIPGQYSPKSALEDILPRAVKYCGRVLYSVHRVENDRIRYQWSGPSDLQELRHETKEMSVTEGCMGATIQAGVPYRIWNNIRGHRGIYVEAAPAHTKSELVVLMPGVVSHQALEVLNLESSKDDAFDDLDAQVFWLIGLWTSLLRAAQESLEDQRSMLLEMARILKGPSILAAPGAKSQERNELRLSLVHALRRSVPFDAISVVSSIPRELSGMLNVDYQYGHDWDLLIKEDFANDVDSFSALVLNKRNTVLAVGKNRTKRLQKYRPATRAAIGAPLDPQAPVGRRLALILEFDDERNFDEREVAATQEIARFVEQLVLQQERARSSAARSRALDALPRLALLRTRTDSYSALLEKATEIITKSLHSTGCGFFEEVENSSGKLSVQKVAFFVDEDTSAERDAYWVRFLNDNWSGKKRLQEPFREGRDFEMALEIEPAPSVPGGPTHYRLFTTPIYLLDRKLLLVSFKAVKRSRAASLEISPTSLQILHAVLEFLNVRIIGMRSEEERRMMEAGLAMALQMAITDESPEGMSLSDRLENLFGRVHRFLGRWSRAADARYSAIFLYEKKGNVLKLSEASMRWLLDIARDQDRHLDGKISRPEFPLGLSDHEGLTGSVFKNGRSLFSLAVDREGADVCKEFWEKVTGRPASDRFFAGAQIPNPKGEPYGVLTLNGVPHVHFGDLRAEWKWRLLPVLETVASELGRAINETEGDITKGN